jgi:DNA mismatch repair protein MutS
VDNKIIFLRKLSPGGSTHSFGIHVARMAGMPPVLVERATRLLELLEKKQGGDQSFYAEGFEMSSNIQLSIFDAHTEVFSEIRQMLGNINIDNLTPVEALVILNEIKKKIR